MAGLTPVYVVTWEEWTAPPVGTKRGRWDPCEEGFDTEEEADALINELAAEGARKIIFEKRYV